MKQKNDFCLINSWLITITNGGTKICIRRFVNALEPKRDSRVTSQDHTARRRRILLYRNHRRGLDYLFIIFVIIFNYIINNFVDTTMNRPIQILYLVSYFFI